MLLADEFCYIWDMLSVDGDAAVTAAKTRSGWFKFRSLASFLTAKDVSLLLPRNFMMRVYVFVRYTEMRRGY